MNAREVLMLAIFLIILAVGLIITFAGLFLSSPRTQVPTPRGMTYPEYGPRIRRASAYIHRQPRTRRLPLEIEPRGWTNIAAPINANSIMRLLRRQHASQEAFWLRLLLILLILLACGAYLIEALHTGQILVPFGPDAATMSLANGNSASNNPSHPNLFAGLIGASKALKRISQVDPGQYASRQDYNIWWNSTCSAASMTEVINAYGHNYRLADILKVEAGLGEITPALGLMERRGIDRTLAQFGFTTTWLTSATLDKVINVANHGRPVIVDFPPSRWPGGHILVVIGGDSNYVYIADS